MNSTAPNTPTDEAITWIARLRSHDVSTEDRSRFAEWLASDAAHPAAFDEIMQLWHCLGVVAAIDAKSLALAQFRIRSTPAALATATIATLALFGLHGGDNFETVDGTQRTVVLEDGSRVLLNSNTRLDVDMAADERRITLHRGEAYFEVAQDRLRPFVVAGQHCTATALGTAFAVRVQPRHDIVIVAEGAVRVAVGEQSIDVGENEEAIVADHVTTAPVDAAAQTAWRNAPQ